MSFDMRSAKDIVANGLISEINVMANNLRRARFWSNFVAQRCGYPAPHRLKAHLDGAEFHDFCDCGCNSFAVKVRRDAPPLISPHDGPLSLAFYHADFTMADGMTIEIILFADAGGHLDYIEVDCCANSCPVPEHVKVGKPDSTWAADSLLS